MISKTNVRSRLLAMSEELRGIALTLPIQPGPRTVYTVPQKTKDDRTSPKRLDEMVELGSRPNGLSMAEMMQFAGWHTPRARNVVYEVAQRRGWRPSWYQDQQGEDRCRFVV
jgi:hypothetical protein